MPRGYAASRVRAMRKLGIAFASAFALAVAAAPAAQAAAVPPPPGGVCETVNYVVVTTTGGLGMHVPVVEDAWHEICAIVP